MIHSTEYYKKYIELYVSLTTGKITMTIYEKEKSKLDSLEVF